MKYLIVLGFLLLLSCHSNPNLLKHKAIEIGRVVSISDGDTFTLLTQENIQKKIRLYGIDCPEKRQPYGTVAKQKLSELIFNKEVEIHYKTTDKYRRTVAMVYLGKYNINEEMIKLGFAWHFKRYDNNNSWDKMEEEARSQGIGLWNDIDPTPPWVWRRK
jgi:micrococcal nuclease